jgi:hypothetical protein
MVHAVADKKNLQFTSFMRVRQEVGNSPDMDWIGVVDIDKALFNRYVAPLDNAQNCAGHSIICVR